MSLRNFIHNLRAAWRFVAMYRLCQVNIAELQSSLPLDNDCNKRLACTFRCSPTSSVYVVAWLLTLDRPTGTCVRDH